MSNIWRSQPIVKPPVDIPLPKLLAFPKPISLTLSPILKLGATGVGSGVGAGVGVGSTGLPIPWSTNACTALYLIPKAFILSWPVPNSPVQTLRASSSSLTPGNGSTGAGFS